MKPVRATNSRTKYRERVRCMHCFNRMRRNIAAGKAATFNGRFTLRRPLASYKRPPKCPVCKQSLYIVSVEKDRQKEAEMRGVCHCSKYPCPHRKGSWRFCENHPLVIDGVEPTDEEYDAWEDVWRTPRGS